MNLWMRLPKHPNIVPFDRIVIDQEFGCYVGFTSIFVPGGTFQENPHRLFKLKWLKQLIAVIDELNLKYGISHQDIAPRNLVLDAASDNLMIFDFNFSARIKHAEYVQARNDMQGVMFTMYEIVTRDVSLRDVEHRLQRLDIIDAKDWQIHPNVKLDKPVAEFRETLTRWRKLRADSTFQPFGTDGAEFIDWPDVPPPPDHPNVVKGFSVKLRQELRENGKSFLEWQRPAQKSLKPGERLLANGKYLVQH